MSSPFNIEIREGEIYLNNERMIITSSSIFSTLKKDLIDNIGIEHMKGFLIRFGWNLGVNDARKSLEKGFSTIRELLRQGPILHMMQGYTKVKTTNLELVMSDSKSVKSVEVKGIWVNSYEADGHLGISHEPVCHTLIGYASGYYSTICGHEVWFKEVACKATGASVCEYEGKSLHLWDSDIQEERRYLQNETIVHELAITYENLSDERNNLAKIFNIHNRLTEEIVKGNNLHSVARVIFQMTHIPLFIKNNNNNQYILFGLSSKESREIKLWFQRKEHFKEDMQTMLFKEPDCEILITPIVMQRKVYGYCGFFYKGEVSSSINQIILERLSAACSLYFLNEKTSFESLERRKGFFLEQILNGEIRSKDEVVKNSRYLESSLEESFYIAALECKHKQKSDSLFLIQQQILEEIYYYFKNNQQTVLSTIRNGYIILLIPSDTTTILQSLQLIHTHLCAIFPEYQFKIGLSSMSNELENVIQVYKEAVTSVRMNKGQQIISKFEDIDILGILIHTGSSTIVNQKAYNTLAPLINYSDAKLPELLKTLYYFLQCGGNLEKTMQMLSISMSGLRYRLKKIEELLKSDIRNPSVSVQLFTSMEILLNEKLITLD